ncbi:hypothetical protein AK812_SmicGene28756 [Symbiodinium microadriaticum]|uniref:Uncharacterized protein n=1 Tax=Symbiodinium microadriaticum TaxID=2951 RepID=A0A1Q9D3Q1_SYMMI|nr:hypothetical protein AK812_SmicGene28756 [Symbiodinium microadriaticum]
MRAGRGRITSCDVKAAKLAEFCLRSAGQADATSLLNNLHAEGKARSRFFHFLAESHEFISMFQMVKLPQSDHLARTRDPQLLTPSIDAIEDIELPFSEEGRTAEHGNVTEVIQPRGVVKDPAPAGLQEGALATRDPPQVISAVARGAVSICARDIQAVYQWAQRASDSQGPVSSVTLCDPDEVRRTRSPGVYVVLTQACLAETVQDSASLA